MYPKKNRFYRCADGHIIRVEGRNLTERYAIGHRTAAGGMTEEYTVPFDEIEAEVDVNGEIVASD